jgi:hypothetical protein
MNLGADPRCKARAISYAGNYAGIKGYNISSSIVTMLTYTNERYLGRPKRHEKYMYTITSGMEMYDLFRKSESSTLVHIRVWRALPHLTQAKDKQKLRAPKGCTTTSGCARHD